MDTAIVVIVIILGREGDDSNSKGVVGLLLLKTRDIFRIDIHGISVAGESEFLKTLPDVDVGHGLAEIEEIPGLHSEVLDAHPVELSERDSEDLVSEVLAVHEAAGSVENEVPEADAVVARVEMSERDVLFLF